MRCAPQNPPVSVLTKGFCDGATNFGPDKRVLRFGCAPQNPPVSVLIKGFCDGLVERGCAPRPTNFGPESALRCQDSCCTNPPLPLQAIPLPPAGNVKKRMACRAGSKDHSGTTLPVGGKGGTVARSAGCCHEIETPAGECFATNYNYKAKCFVLLPGQICQVWNCDNVHWQPQQSSASRFVSPKLELNK